MVLESTWRVQAVLRFILIRNYNGFAVDMDSLVQLNLHFSQELQWFRGGHGFFSSSELSFLQGIAMVSWWACILYIEVIFVCVRVSINQSTNQ